jgi:hypothetical protein
MNGEKGEHDGRHHVLRERKDKHIDNNSQTRNLVALLSHLQLFDDDDDTTLMVEYTENG